MLFKFLDEEEKFEQTKKERAEMELKFLKSQINPHVLLNNLNTIYSYAIEKPTETPNLILKLSENLKHVLYETSNTKVSLQKEIAFIENYIEFQKIRTEGIKKVSYQQNIDQGNYNIAPLLLITLIENTFKHSIPNSLIEIKITVNNGELNFNSKNTFKESDTVNDGAIGLKNIQKRLSLIYPQKHSLRFNKENTIFTVQLSLKLN